MPVNLRPAIPSDESPSFNSRTGPPRPEPTTFSVPEGIDNYDPWLAAKHGRTEYLNFYIDHYPQQLTRLSHRPFSRPRYPLALAAQNGHLDAVRLLVEALPTQSVYHRNVRFNVDSIDPQGKTALLYAIDNDEKYVTRYLLWQGGANGARPALDVRCGFFRRRDFSNALLYAVHVGAARCVGELLAWHASCGPAFNVLDARRAAVRANDGAIIRRIDRHLDRYQPVRPHRRRQR